MVVGVFLLFLRKIYTYEEILSIIVCTSFGRTGYGTKYKG